MVGMCLQKEKKYMVIHYQGSRICRHVKFWIGGKRKENFYLENLTANGEQLINY